ncbi:P-loop NTPase fold protein [Acinetobacter nosocomialis]|uniref:P-loop NTPase fold protein n=1 Tax=Acinetobacter nosocomialis TaxID=106654 RepID=UPI001A9AC97B|nr:P-loop NTPase fold protein [Acinetobacter nosocomialis]MBO1279636.1 KAP family P-loop domain protein [Acinetobacter nosocomialis]
MNVLDKEKRLKELLENNIRNEKIGTAIAITGPWGVGKTFFWNKFYKNVTYKEIRDKKNFYYEASRINYESIFDCRKYAYISLFGIENLSDLKNTICTKLTLNPHAKSDIDRFEFIQLLKNTLAQFRDVKVSSYGVSTSARVLESLLFLQVKNSIICFDDFERMSKNLDIKDVMGLANYLKLEKNCQIILILDEDKSDNKNKDKYSSYKEKLVDETIILSSVEPLIRENTSGFDERLVELMISFADHLEIHNFRFFQKVIKLYQNFLNKLPTEVAYSTKEIILTRILQGYLITDFGNELKISWKDFTIEEFVKIYDENEKDKLDDIRVKTLINFNKVFNGAFNNSDGWFIQFKNWFEQRDLDSPILYSLANSEMISEEKNRIKEEKSRLWKNFWNNQIDEEFPSKLYEIYILLIGTEDIENLVYAHEILMKLNAQELAYKLKANIYRWINSELKKDKTSFIDSFTSWRRSKNIFYDYVDKYEKQHLYEGLPDLLEVIYDYTIQKSWKKEHVYALEVATEAEWEKLLFELIPNDDRFNNVNSSLIATKMIKQSMEPKLNSKIKQIIIKIYQRKGQKSVFYKRYMDYLISRLDD